MFLEHPTPSTPPTARCGERDKLRCWLCGRRSDQERAVQALPLDVQGRHGEGGVLKLTFWPKI